MLSFSHIREGLDFTASLILDIVSMLDALDTQSPIREANQPEI